MVDAKGERLKITLKAARMNTGFTQEEAAKRVGVSVSTLKNWELGNTCPRQPAIEKLCKLYNVRYDDINFLPF